MWDTLYAYIVMFEQHHILTDIQRGCRQLKINHLHKCSDNMKIIAKVISDVTIIVQQPEGVTLQKYPQTRLLLILIEEVM